MEIQQELNLDHEQSMEHWAKLIANYEIQDGASNWDYEYEQAWHFLDAQFNYEIVRP